MSPSTKALPYIIKDNFIQVTIPKKGPFTLNASHPTFSKLREALKKKQWSRVPKLVNLAQTITLEAHGQIDVFAGVVTYKGHKIKSSLTDRILEMIHRKKNVKHMVMFMDNLYQNPSDRAISSFYDWIQDNDLPITDDGCFLAYKSVNQDFTDKHTGTISNHPGQVIMMSRKVCDTDYDNQCSTGFHICSKQYGLYGSRVLAVKANPKHVLSAPEGGKMRVTQYEVLKDLGSPSKQEFQEHGLSELEKQLVIEVGKERKELIKMLLKSTPIQRMIKSRKIKKSSIMKASYARVNTLVHRFDLVPKLGPDEKNRLEKARKASGLTIGQIAKAMKVSYKTIAQLEKKENVSVEQEANYIKALADITDKTHGISYSKVNAAVA